MCCFACCACTCVFGPACVWVLLWLPRVKTQWWNPSIMHLFIQRKDCFLLELRKGNTSIVNPLSVITKQELLVALTLPFKSRRVANTLLPLWTVFSCFSSCLSDSLFISQTFLPSSLFAFTCCVFLFCWTRCWSLHVEYSKELYHIMERASCQDDFIMSQSVLCLTVSSHSFHASLCHSKSMQPVLWHYV